MIFIGLLLVITLAIASTAAFFSVWGLAEVFSGSFVAVVIMGTVLEAGKLMSASFLYRYWHKISVLMKTYLILAIVMLMVITSIGIFGKLSYSYQQDVFSLTEIKQNLEILQDQVAELNDIRDEFINRKKQIDNDIASLPNNYVTGRQRLMKSYKDELERLQQNITSITTQIATKKDRIHELKRKMLQEQIHVGPIVYIAKMFNQQMDDATKWLIFMIIFAFDPLAIILTIGTNIAIVEHKRNNRNVATDDNNEIASPGTLSVDELKKWLDQNKNRKLTPEEQAQRAMYEEMLNKKALTTKIRNPTA